MRPAHVYARIPAEQHTELITALHGPWRTANRMVIIVLSAAGLSASEIADLLHYDPVTVRRWITRHHNEGLAGLPDRPRTGRPAKAATALVNASIVCCKPRKPGPPPASGEPSAVRT